MSIWISIAIIISLLVAAVLGLCWFISGSVLKPVTSNSTHSTAAKPVSFAARDGISISGQHYGPAQRPTIVICAGHSQTMVRDQQLANSLFEAGFSVLQFDWRGRGSSEGKRNTFGMDEPKDLLGALDYLQASGVAQIGVLGSSLGGGVALRSNDARVSCLVVDSPMLSARTVLHGALVEKFGTAASALTPIVLLMLTIRLGRSLAPLVLIEAISDQKLPPVMLITGEHDLRLPAAGRDQLLQSLGNTYEHWHVEDAGHRNAYTIREEEYVERVTAFFGKWLV